ncbi:unnamed protein product [Meloidogyne enterolobii]|uniref:Uncharacterized protein n=1 Tax=Meloidogyne enterolobii TaxID=390850 RepID=A0ACB0XQ87_MELEN
MLWNRVLFLLLSQIMLHKSYYLQLYLLKADVFLLLLILVTFFQNSGYLFESNF